ncbi:hypothetical protein H1P_440027 [Hyella patelloides LEGE 07179]|uniref:Uncharacterized protein n=1 Tax=Hyella patelloides LEGE 07179 TaxID=945734 RepID=A0A563VY68_9CYAN|nr:hypothetical protein H1P_440027 [Hyella patelloides LEGE 07179]
MLLSQRTAALFYSHVDAHYELALLKSKLFDSYEFLTTIRVKNATDKLSGKTIKYFDY